MEETGIIEKILPEGEVIVVVERSSACGKCDMSGFCFTDDAKVLRIKGKVDFPVHEGQTVHLTLDSRNFLKYSFITYMIPVLLLIIGAAIGSSIAGDRSNPLFAIIGGFTGLLAGMLFVKKYSGRLEAKNKVVVKVLDGK